MLDLGQDGIERSRTIVTFRTNTEDGRINTHGDQSLCRCSVVLADCNEQRLERCDNILMEV